MPDTVVLLDNVRKVYDTGAVKVEALRGVTLDVHEGDYVAIMGTSGSGKSTLLNLLGCLDRPTSGKYVLAGYDVATLSDDDLSALRCRKIGFIFQSYNLIPQLTVVENIEVPLQYAGRDAPIWRQRCIELAEMVGLGERLDHRPTQLSGGQQQRVAIARALVNSPSFLLADEATGNLDSATTNEIMTLLDRLNREGMTIIMVTHEEDIALHARRVIRMADGKVVQDRLNQR